MRISLKLKNSLIILCVILPLLAIFLAFDISRQTAKMHSAITERGIVMARTGAATAGKLLSDAIEYGLLTEEEVFDANYRPIPGTDPPKYHTAFDAYTDANFQQVQDSFLKDPYVVYAVALNKDGYVPTHNTISKRGYGDNPARSKRIFDDPVGLAAVQGQETHVFQVYRRDTGEIIWDIASPIYVNGRHWGGFRLGFSIDETEKQIAAVRNQIIGGGLILILALVIAVLYVTRMVTDPVAWLEEKINAAAAGDLSAIELKTTPKDELGSLIHSFADMVDRLRNLAERMRYSVGMVTNYTEDLKRNIHDAANVTNVAAAKMTGLSETMKKLEGGAAQAACASEKVVASLVKAEEASDKFLQQMRSSTVVMTRAGESVKELESYVEKVGEIIMFISLIADQTRLLARKAVAEAGELCNKDSDFSSLAEEIQNRANDAASATKGISSIFDKAQGFARQASIALEKDQQVVQEGHYAAAQAADSFKVIKADLQGLENLVKEVVAGARQVSEGIDGINTAAGEQAALVKGFIEAAELLDEVTEEMQETLMSLKI